MACCRKSLWNAEFIVTLRKIQFVILLKIAWKRTKHFDLGLVPQEVLHKNQIAFNKCLLYWGHRFTLRVHRVHWKRQKIEEGMECLSLVQAAPCEWGWYCALNPWGGDVASSTLTRVGLSLPTFWQLHKSNSCFRMKLWEANIAVNPSTTLTGISLFYNHSWRRKWQPTPVFLSGESIDRGAWQAIVHGVARVRHDLVTKPTTIIIHFYDHFFFHHEVGPSLFKRIRHFSVHFAFGHKHYLKGKTLFCIRLVICSL